MDPSVPAAAVAAAAVTVTHPADEGKDSDSGPQPMDIDGQWTIARSRYHGVPLTLTVYDAHMCGPSVCAAMVTVPACTASPRMDGRHQLCERCPRRLSQVKGKPYYCPPGLMCHKCYNKEHACQAASKRPAGADAEAAAPAPKRVRRTQSDPGEAISLTRKRTRAQPPHTEPTVKKTRVRTPAVDPSLLLDQSHARRLALLAAVATDAAHCVPNASAVVFDT
jgi:hypothetical protein